MSKVERRRELYEEAGKPGARVFRTFARRKGEDITASEAQQFVSQQATSQVFQGRLRSDGKVTASRHDIPSGSIQFFKESDVTARRGC